MDNIDKIFMCDIMTQYNEEHVDLEQVLIHAESLSGAFEKLVNLRNYVNKHIYEMRDDSLFAHVEIEGHTSPKRQVLIGIPSEIIK